MSRKGLPSWIIKKYGVTKKAWQVFRGGGKKRSNPRKRGESMSPDPRRRRRYFGKSRKGGGGARGFLGGWGGLLTGLVVLTIAKVLIRRSNQPILQTYDDEATVAGYGAFLSVKNRSFSPVLKLAALMFGAEWLNKYLVTMGV